MIAGNLTTVECQRTVVEDTTAVACGVTTDNLTTFGIHNGKNTIIDDDATVGHSTCQRAVDGMSVQFEHNGLAFRYGQGCVGALCNDISCQLDNTTVAHRFLQACPARNRISFFIHLDAGILTIHSGNLAVLHSDMYCLRRHTRLCR